jgi:hypothetical protein
VLAKTTIEMRQEASTPLHQASNADLTVRRREILSEAFSRGGDHPDKTFLHGTSVRALQAALETGCIPTGLKSDHFTDGHIYFAPLPSRFTIENPHCSLPRSDKEALSWVKTYAKTVSRRLAVVERLNLSSDSQTDCFFAERFSGMDYPEEFQLLKVPPSLAKSGFDQGRATELFWEIERDQKELGVVLFFSSALARGYSIEQAEGRDEGVRINSQKGIRLEYLVGIEPQGQEAWEILEAIQQSVASK